MHLHNALILGILYNATADVPGPSSPKLFAVGKHKREQSGLDAGEEDEDPKRKRLRTMVAGLSKKERQRLKLAGKPPKAGAGAVASAANLGWAGAGADMLEKKRKEEEKRKAAEEKRRVREATSAIGSRDWKAQTVQAAEQASAVSSKLSHCKHPHVSHGADADNWWIPCPGLTRNLVLASISATQQALARALSAPLCIESKELPDLDMLRDRMTLIALEAGLPGGVHHQAAAMMLAALQVCNCFVEPRPCPWMVA